VRNPIVPVEFNRKRGIKRTERVLFHVMRSAVGRRLVWGGECDGSGTANAIAVARLLRSMGLEDHIQRGILVTHGNWNGSPRG
jgi:hypothetical protein